MPLFLFTQHTVVVENNNAAIRVCVRGAGLSGNLLPIGNKLQQFACACEVLAGMGPELLEPMERRNRTSLARIFPQNR